MFSRERVPMCIIESRERDGCKEGNPTVKLVDTSNLASTSFINLSYSLRNNAEKRVPNGSKTGRPNGPKACATSLYGNDDRPILFFGYDFHDLDGLSE